ncbi:MAG: DUF11 domain-containing protein [Ideonella sp.]|nr:DUF11 domain-containing protein [Ideonella sp.]
MLRAWGLALLLGLPALAQAAADPQITGFTDTPDPVPAGGLYVYSVGVDNNAADAATNVVVTVPVPAGAQFVSAAAPCALVGSNVVCTVGAVAGNGADPRSLSITMKAVVAGPATINATATLTASNDSNASNNVQNQITTVTQGADLSLAKSASPDPVAGGANLSYTLTPSNAGPNDSGNLRVIDNLPPLTSFVSASGSGWSCSHSAGTVTCDRNGPHAIGAIPIITIVAQVNTASGTVTNAATISPAPTGGVADPDNSNNTASVSTAVIPGADVQIAQKTVTSGTPAIAGSAVSFLIKPRNAGPAAANNVTVVDNLPAGWVYVSASGPNWACGAVGQQVSCTRAALPLGATDDITIVATAPNNAAVGPAGTSYTNSATASTSSADPVPGNNTASTNFLVLPDGADLSLSKSKSPNPVALGANMTSTMVLTNAGPRTATGLLRIIDVLAAGETYVGFSGAGWSCANNAGTVTCDHANAGGLAVGASLPTLTLTTTATGSGNLTNIACTGSTVPPGAALGTTASPPAQGDPNGANDCASAGATSTVLTPDLSIAKATTTPSGGDKIVSSSEGSVTYTLTVNNLTAGNAASGVVITDTVPAYISGRTTIQPVTANVSAGTATFACGISGATVTCTQTGGALNAGETVTVPITVNRPLLDGSFTNTATVANTVQGDPVAGNNSASDTVQIDPVADVELVGKTTTPASVRAGEPTTYVISYRNNGPSIAQNVVVNDVFAIPGGDSGATVLSFTSSKGSCSGSGVAVGDVISGSAAFSCNIGTLANNESQTITLVLRPNFQTGNPVRSWSNTASITTSSVENPAGGDNGNNSRSATLAINPAAVDLLVNKIDFVDPVPFDGNAFLDYRVRVTSGGPSYATAARITESMLPPAGKRVRFVCDTTGAQSATCNSPSLCSSVNQTSTPGSALPPFTCSLPAGNASTGSAIGDLASGQSKDIFLRFEALDSPPAAGDVFNNTASVSSNEPDTNAGNNTISEATTVRQRIDLAVQKAVSTPNVTVKQAFTWTVTVTNHGPGNSLQTDLTDALPAGVAITGAVQWTKTAPAASGTCSVASGNLACALGLLNHGGTVTIVIPARFDTLPAGGAATNTATVDTDPAKIGGIDPVPGNNSASVPIAVTKSSLAGTVFEDRDRSGANGGTPQAAASEPRIAGVTVTLTGTDAYGNAVSLSTTTDSSGDYLFDNLAPSGPAGYTVTETQPTGYGNSPSLPPTSGAAAPSLGGTHAAGGATGNSSYAGVVVGGNNAGLNYNFPELRRPSLSGFVYVDVDRNGTRNPALDTPIAGATVRLLNAATQAVVATASTDASGFYRFTDLDPLLSYTLEEPLPASPAELINGPVNPGLVNGNACVTGCIAQPNGGGSDTDRIASIDLSSGADATLFNFGEIGAAVISGTVYLDRNHNNALDPTPTDGRLAGVTLTLHAGNSCAGELKATVVTDANGNYSFPRQVAGLPYAVCETQPAGYADGATHPGTGGVSSASGVISIGSLPASGSPANNFGERGGSLSGYVFLDQANDGSRAGDPALAGVTITLSGLDASGQAVNRSTTTDAAGAWRFIDLPAAGAAGYTVREQIEQPLYNGSVTSNGQTLAGSVGGVPTSPSARPSAIAAIPLAAGVDGTEYNFGEILTTGISGRVYIDRNTNGTLDAADVGLGGVRIELHPGSNCQGPVIDSASTDSNGNYGFGGLLAGSTYTVCEVQPLGYGDSATNPGNSASSAVANAITVGNLPATGSNGNHFGELASTLAGNVFLDRNNDGQRTGEPGLPGVTITLSGVDAAGRGVTRTTTTDANGAWAFADLPASGPSGYSVTEQAEQPVFNGVPTSNGQTVPGSHGGSATTPAATPSAITRIVLPAGVTATEYNFGEIERAFISGTVFLDRNRNGQLDVGTDGFISGVTVTLYAGTTCSGTPLTANLTDPQGRYSFANLDVGKPYAVCETQPSAFGQGIELAGPGGSNPAPNLIVIASLPSGGSPNNHFGERLGSIAGHVFLDASNDGQRTGDAGIPGVVVTLTGTDVLGNPVQRSATTDSNGDWRFDELTASGPGGYTVTEQAQQPAFNGTATRNGQTVAGNLGGNATPVSVLPSAIGGIALPGGADGIEYNFGELPTEVVAPVIRGTVYIDSNRDGRLDGADGRLAGVVVTLYAGATCTGIPLASVVTDATGAYAFTQVQAGKAYTLCETQPTTHTDASTNPGTAADSPAANVIRIGSLPAGGSTENNFGELPKVAATPDLVVTKAANAAPFTAGAGGSYTLRVRNLGSGASNGSYSLSDHLPVGMTLAATPSGTGWSCTGAVGAGSFSCSSAAVLAAGAEAPTITVSVSLAPALAGGVSLSNVALVEGGGEPDSARPTTAEREAFDGNPSALPLCTTPATQNACRVDTPVTPKAPSPDLVVAKAANAANFTAGANGAYTLRVRNLGSGASVGSYSLSDRLPAGMTLAATPSGTGWSCTGAVGASSFSCSSAAVLAAGAEAPAITVGVNLAPALTGGISLSNVVLVEGGGEPDSAKPTPAEREAFGGNPLALPLCTQPATANACRVDTTVMPAPLPPDLVVSKVSGAASFTPGRSASYTLRVRNRGAGASSGSISVIDRLPAGMTLAAIPSGSGWACTGAVGASSFSCSSATVLAAGGQANDIAVQVSLASTLTAGATLSNAALVEGGGEPESAQPTPAEREAFNGLPSALPLCTTPATQNACRASSSVVITPTGVVYDSLTRQPVPGAVVTLAPSGNCPGWSPAQQVIGASTGGYTVNGASISMVTGADGVYTFVLLPNAPALCSFAIQVTPPPGQAFTSKVIPPATAPLIVSAKPGETQVVQAQAVPPSAPVGTGTTYYLELNLGSSTADVAHNHIPLDKAAPPVPARLLLRKTSDRQTLEVGNTVRYTITLTLASGTPPAHLSVVDQLPLGFTYVAGTARVGEQAIADPAGGRGPTLAFELGAMPASGSVTLTYRARADAGSLQGDGINRATVYGCAKGPTCTAPGGFAPREGSVASNEAQHRVKLTGVVFAAEACVLGKVFVDCNGNHVQDAEELGIPGVRLVMQDGTTLISDSEGKYSVCGLPARSHVLRIDPLTLPRGGRLTTSSNRNLGDAGSLWLDLKSGEMHRADFIEGSCSNTVIEQVKARRAQGEVRAPETEKPGQPALRFDSKAHGLSTLTSPQQGTDGANQQVPKARANTPALAPDVPEVDEQSRPVPGLPMNQPPPTGRSPGDAPDAPSTAAKEARHGTR